MHYLKKILKLLATGTVSLFIAACYGAPVQYGEVETTVRVTTATGEPITGLRVNTGGYYSTEYYFTNESGEAVFFPIVDPESDGYMDIIIKDIDGPENLGAFARTVIPLGQEAFHEVVAQPNQYTYAEYTRTCRFLTETGEPIPNLKVNLSEFGSLPDEFCTDENGEVTFNPLLNPDGDLEPIYVTDKDWTEAFGYFGSLVEFRLTEDSVLEFVLVPETPPEPESTGDPETVPQGEPKGDKAGEDAPQS